jgi:hypothetical protein
MIFTQIFVVMCATGGCTNYVDLRPGALSGSACEHAIWEIARDHAVEGAALDRDRSFCSLMPGATRNDLES